MRNRRLTGFVVVGLSIIFLITSLLVPVALAKAPYDRYAGDIVVCCFPNHVQYNAAMKVIPEFEKETGIKVEVDMLQYMRMHEKELLEMSKPVGDYDVISLVCMWKTEYVVKGLLAELAPYFANPALADPYYDQEDIVFPYLGTSAIVGGLKGYLPGPGASTYGIPFGSETSILAYRKDLFDKYGLTTPDNYDELLDAATFFAEQVPGIFGLTMRGAAGHQAGHSWLNFADPFGAKVFDELWQPAFQKKESLEALSYMRKFVETGPPGIPGFGFDAMANAFLQGKAAMFLDATAIFGMVPDPKLSKIVGKVVYAPHPKHKKRAGETGGFAIAIPNNSKNKEAAFLFIQWLTNKENTKKVCLAGGVPFRWSVLNDPEVREKFPEYKFLAEALKYADPDWRPIIPAWPEVEEEHLGIAVNLVLAGAKSPEEAMNAEVEPVREIMKKAGYYTWLK